MPTSPEASRSRIVTLMDVAVGERIARLRLGRGMTQAELAEAIGVGVRQVERYETGRIRVGFARLRATAKFLGVEVQAFFEPEAPPVTPSALAELRVEGALDLLRTYATIEDAAIRQRVLEVVRAASTTSRARGDGTP